jgi:hypothetical protein
MMKSGVILSETHRLITQNTKCFADFIRGILRIHARARGIKDNKVIDETIELANKFTGKKSGRTSG